ncbi:hypothetical protein CDL15_Pgr028042 [Punica granatum]|uniref:CHCH domain-containing protein n=1 Tax=Punica granatum TaxID=22663 RepID=A0A218XJ72_PUNGR|nr:hypothetical protein CDL15_Pgr028042 [Punica granatum]
MSEAGAKPVCAQEALDLLNCVAQTPYDQEKCVRLLQSLRDCVLNKLDVDSVPWHFVWNNKWFASRVRLNPALTATGDPPGGDS